MLHYKIDVMAAIEKAGISINVIQNCDFICKLSKKEPVS